MSEKDSNSYLNWLGYLYKDYKRLYIQERFKPLYETKRKIIIHKKKFKKTIKLSVKFLGVQLKAELNFNLHIVNICRSAGNQLNALTRLRKFLGSEEKNVVINS